MDKDIRIIVATHKEYQMPTDAMYFPLQVGAAGKKDLGYNRDDEGDNISLKNPFYSELTGLYWAYKNLDNDYIGLVHYRRYFSNGTRHLKSQQDKFANLMTRRQAGELLEECDVIVPKMRNYYIENLYDHYCHTLDERPLIETEKIISEMYPDYQEEFQRLHNRKKAHMFNMMVMKKEVLAGYCDWLFSILFALEKRIDVSEYDAFGARFFGRISELLLDVYLNVNKINYVEADQIDMESVNWFKKGTSFLAAKFFGRKYDKSF